MTLRKTLVGMLDKMAMFYCIFAVFSTISMAECPTADLNSDCYVNMADLQVLASQWLTGTSTQDLSLTPLVYPGDSLQAAYDWLKSPNRDQTTGPASKLNRRAVLLMPGLYDDNLTIDANFVDIVAVDPASTHYTGTITVSPGVYDYRIVDYRSADFASNSSSRPAKIVIPHSRVVYEELFDGTSSFKTTNCSIANDPVNYMVGNTAPVASKATCVNSGYTSFFCPQDVFTPAKNWAHMSWGIRFYIAPQDLPNIAFIQVSFSTDASFANSRKFTAWNANGLCAKGGWNDYTGTIQSGVYTDTGVFDQTCVCNYAIYIGKKSADSQPSVTFDYLRVWDGRLKTPLYCLTFDDNHINQNQAVAYANAKGIPATIYAIGGWTQIGVDVAGAPGLTIADLQRMKRAGNLIANHSFNHTGWGSWNVNYASKLITYKTELIRNIEWMLQNGFGDGARIFASPGGGFGTNYDIEFAGYYDQIRVVYGMAGSGVHLTSLWDYNSELKVATQDNAANAALGLVKLIGTAANSYTDGDGAVLITVFHQIDGLNGRISMTDYKAHIDAVAAFRDAGLLKCVTINRLLDEMEYITNP